MLNRFYEWLLPKKSGLEVFAERELDLINMTANSKDKMTRELRHSILSMIRVFSNAGHSGSSAAITNAIVHRLLKFEPLTPLTGHDNEWMQVTDHLWQNTRCSRVFKDENNAWDIDGRVFMGDGCQYTNADSKVVVEFPYIPKTEYVDVE